MGRIDEGDLNSIYVYEYVTKALTWQPLQRSAGSRGVSFPLRLLPREKHSTAEQIMQYSVHRGYLSFSHTHSIFFTGNHIGPRLVTF